MRIHQFTMQFSAEEDRIIFRIRTLDNEEFRFYLTRRFVKMLWPLLIQLMENDYRRREPDKSHIADVMVNFEHENIISKMDFKQPYYGDSIKSYPLGQDTVLLSQIRINRHPEGDVLCLLPTSGQGVEFQANYTFLHTFCRLLKDTVANAGWDIHFEFTDKNIQPSSKVLH